MRVGGQQGSPICFLRDALTDPTVEEHIVFNTRTCVWLHVSTAVTAVLVTFDCAIVICLLIVFHTLFRHFLCYSNPGNKWKKAPCNHSNQERQGEESQMVIIPCSWIK